MNRLGFGDVLERRCVMSAAEHGSFKPWPWYRNLPEETYREDEVVYVYRQSDLFEWTVGYYTPSGEWMPESTWDSKEKAAERVRWLNGGNM